jgi:hypothetical protein
MAKKRSTAKLPNVAVHIDCAVRPRAAHGKASFAVGFDVVHGKGSFAVRNIYFFISILFFLIFCLFCN